MPATPRYGLIMLIATWVLAGATAVIAISSLWAIITWRENRQRQAREAMQAGTVEAVRKEFVSKDQLAEIKTSMDNRTFLMVAAAVVGVMVGWDKLTGGTKPKD